VNTDLGFAHFLTQSDTLGKVLLAILVAMSVASWAIIAVKGLTLALRKGRSSAFLDFFWNARSLEAVAGEIATHGARDPFSHLTSHRDARPGAPRALRRRQARGGRNLERVRHAHDQEGARRGNRLASTTASRCSRPSARPRRSSACSAPVWGVYHALVAIGMSGSGTLDKVAGPVGEALIMTGLGLAVAIPAVVGYNWLTRPTASSRPSSTPSPTSCTPSSRWASRSARAPATAARPTYVQLAARPAAAVRSKPWHSPASIPGRAARRWRRSTWSR
jgi:biopolymer transport protein ExbB